MVFFSASVASSGAVCILFLVYEKNIGYAWLCPKRFGPHAGSPPKFGYFQRDHLKLQVRTPMQYSNFGFFPRQIGARRVICPMILIRLLCGGALLFIVQLGDCSLTSVFFCRCYRHVEGPKMNRSEGWFLPDPGGYSDIGRTWSCNVSPELWLYNKEAVDENYPLQDSGQRVLAQGRAHDVCNGTDLVEPSFGQHWASGTQQPTNKELNLSSSRWCAPESSMPAMLSPSCQRHEIDLVGFQVCLKSVPGVFETMCSGIFLLCAIWVGRDPVVFTYLFVPTAALLVLVLMHCVAQLCSASLANVEENKPSRKEIRNSVIASNIFFFISWGEDPIWWTYTVFVQIG